MSTTYAEQVMREHCSITWVVKGETIRDCTQEEMLKLRGEQVAAREAQEDVLPYAEIAGLTTNLSTNRALIRDAHAFHAQAKMELCEVS